MTYLPRILSYIPFIDVSILCLLSHIFKGEAITQAPSIKEFYPKFPRAFASILAPSENPITNIFLPLS